MSESKQPHVAIFGAGVAGLTAAHELIERGFRVSVFEQGNFELKKHTVDDDRLERWRDERVGWKVGGLARSQLHLLASSKDDPHFLPGEHGFRVFPSFYRHLFDTLKRIPTFPPERFESGAAAPAPSDPYRRVSDNLVPVSLAGVALEGRLKLYEFDQRRPRSLTSLLHTALLLLDGFGYRSVDLWRFALKMLQYATSCRARRLGEYEKQTLWQYLGGERYEERFQRHLNSIPRALVAMDAYRADARTQLNILIQHWLDLSTNGEQVNRVLNGPTSDQWLRHWQVYLEEQQSFDVGGSELARRAGAEAASGVKFHLEHVLEGFELGPPDAAGRRVIQGARVLQLEEVGTAHHPIEVEADYYVLALPISSMGFVKGGIEEDIGLEEILSAELAEEDARWCPDDPAIRRLRELLSKPADQYTEWLSGAQIYLSEDLRLLAGHIFFPDSPWGLSVVSQAQFWSPASRLKYLQHGVRGVLSIDIANWDRPGLVHQKSAKLCTHRELGEELWAQMQAGLHRGPGSPPPGLPDGQPYVDHHLDLLVTERAPNGDLFPRCTCWREGDKDRAADAVIISPMMINPPGSWALRPGPLPERERLHQGYRLRLGGKLVLAGAYTQTFMGLHTMEAANESARHAVNAILEAENQRASDAASLLTRRYEPCAIWPLEDYEPEDLEFWRKLDEDLYALGDPHFLEILSVEALLDLLLPRDVQAGQSASVEEIERRVEQVFAEVAKLARR